MKKIIILATVAIMISPASYGQNVQQQTALENDAAIHPIDMRMDKAIDEDPSTVGMLEAYTNAAEEWEAEINKNYQTLTKRLGGNAGIKKLQAAQKAYEAFYKDETHFNAYYWNTFSGTMYAVFSAYYPVNMSRHRAFQLAAYYDKNAFYDFPFENNTETKTEEEWDKALNDNYKALMAKLDKANQDRLRAAQRKWITYRDAEDDAYNSCCLIILNPEYRLLLVRERALRLKSYLDDLLGFEDGLH